MVLPLSHTPPTADAHIVWIASEPAKREHLEKQGFVPGAVVHCVHRSRRRRFFLFRVDDHLIFLPGKLAREIFAEIRK